MAKLQLLDGGHDVPLLRNSQLVASSLLPDADSIRYLDWLSVVLEPGVVPLPRIATVQLWNGSVASFNLLILLYFFVVAWMRAFKRILDNTVGDDFV